MPKRPIALLIAAGFSSVAAGCHGCGESRACMELAVVTAPVWVPIVLIEKATQPPKAPEEPHRTDAEIRADAEKLRADAEKGDPEAEYEIGNQYWGSGKSEDAVEGVKWYRRSAEQGFADAQVILGFAYQTGHGAAQDNVQADAWYIVAGSSEKSPAQTIDLAVQRREIIEASMTPEQVAEARKRARDFKPIETGANPQN